MSAKRHGGPEARRNRIELDKPRKGKHRWDDDEPSERSPQALPALKSVANYVRAAHAGAENSGSALRKTITRRLAPGEVCYAPVPFMEDETQYKTRPVVVVEVKGDDVTVLPLTGSLHAAAYVLADWTLTGLKKPSGVRGASIALPRREIGTLIGELSQDDFSIVQALCVQAA